MNPKIIKKIKKLKSIKNVGSGWYGYRLATVGIDGKIVNSNHVSWEYCRDRVQLIHSRHFETNGLYFSHAKDTANNVMAFLHKIETILKLKRKSRFANTNFPGKVFWINLSPFWLENLMRRSFLTFALRCGQKYIPEKDNFWEAFEINKYGKNTIPAVKLFLDGYTLYKGTLTMFQGWSKLFYRKTDDQIKKQVAKRRSKNTPHQLVAKT